MKKIILIAGLIFLIFLIKEEGNLAPNKEGERQKEEGSAVLSPDEKVKIAWVKIHSEKKIFLIPNFEEKRSSPQIVEKENCEILTSAGFYDEGGSPLGLFKKDGVTLGKEIRSSLFNGFLDLDRLSATISPTLSSQNIFQTGPVFYREGEDFQTSLISNGEGRRIVFVKAKDGKAYFLAIYNKNSAFDGPKLSLVKPYLEYFAREMGIEIEEAINLDGGAASVFFTPQINLPEITNAGAFICIK